MMLELPEWPTERAELADWLERRIAGPGLRDFAVTLVAMGPDRDVALKAGLEDTFPSKVEAILNSGLATLSDEELREFRPELLLVLQDRVLLEGGSRWTSLIQEEADPQALLRIRRSAEGALEQDPVSRPVAVEPPSSRGGGVRWIVASAAVLAVAATVVVVANVLWSPPSAVTPWTFPEGALAADLPADEYLERLAGEFEASAAARPTGTQATRAWLQANIDGCDAILAAAHEPLDAEDRGWLLERCRVWREGLSKQLAALQEPDPEVEAAGTGAEEVLRRSVKLLRERAENA